jgi:hypothetical protein
VSPFGDATAPTATGSSNVREEEFGTARRRERSSTPQAARKDLAASNISARELASIVT